MKNKSDKKNNIKKEYIKKSKKYVANTYARFDLLLESGNGSKLKDIDRKEYIDLGSGIGVNSLGYNNKNWIKTINNQLNKLQHTSNLYYNKPYIKLAEKLCSITKFDKVFFANSGAEANEAAIKCARKYSFIKYGKNAKRYNIVSLKILFMDELWLQFRRQDRMYFIISFFLFWKDFYSLKQIIWKMRFQN